MSEGYLLIAVDRISYVHMAVNAALSIRRYDDRPVALLTNIPQSVAPDIAPFFDKVVTLDDKGLRGASNKAHGLLQSPWDRTMYVDCDTLMMRAGVNHFWNRLRGTPFTVEGNNLTSGKAFVAWQDRFCDIDKVIANYGVSYMPGFNGGVLYYEQGEVLRQFHDIVLDCLATDKKDQISYPYKFEGEYADEPLFSYAMARLGLHPFPVTDRLNRLQATTPSTADHHLDVINGTCMMVKAAGSPDVHIQGGIICHFCGLQPRDIYVRNANDLRKRAGLQTINFTD